MFSGRLTTTGARNGQHSEIFGCLPKQRGVLPPDRNNRYTLTTGHGD